ncbi:MAG: DUF3006 domain-containing protein [Halanaerobiaceae bacterium]|nr:DUF3006 domain-containing protein [Halanaerobiaceae bacterium]
MLILDRFEGNMAIIECEDKMLEIPIKYLPAAAKEGDILKLVIDEGKTDKRREKIQKLADSLFE